MTLDNGVHVQIQDGRITKGPKSLEGKKPGDLHAHGRKIVAIHGHERPDTKHAESNPVSYRKPQVDWARRVVRNRSDKPTAYHRMLAEGILGKDHPLVKNAEDAAKPQFVDAKTREERLQEYVEARKSGAKVAKPKHGSEMGYRGDKQQKRFEHFLDSEYEAKHGVLDENDFDAIAAKRKEAAEAAEALQENKDHDSDSASEQGSQVATKSSIEKRLLDYHEMVGGNERGINEDDENQTITDRQTTFWKKLPGEVRHFLDGRQHLRKFFHVTEQARDAGGADAMGEMGVDRYFATLEGALGSEMKAAVKSATHSNDQEMQLLGTIYQNRQPGTKQIHFPINKLQHGHRFTINGDEFDVEETEDGKTIKGPAHYPEIPSDADWHIPIDKGSLKKRKEAPMTAGDGIAPFSAADIVDNMLMLSNSNHDPRNGRFAVKAAAEIRDIFDGKSNAAVVDVGPFPAPVREAVANLGLNVPEATHRYVSADCIKHIKKEHPELGADDVSEIPEILNYPTAVGVSVSNNTKRIWFIKQREGDRLALAIYGIQKGQSSLKTFYVEAAGKIVRQLKEKGVHLESVANSDIKCLSALWDAIPAASSVTPEAIIDQSRSIVNHILLSQGHLFGGGSTGGSTGHLFAKRASGGHWVTIDGTHVHISGEGKIDKGPSALVGKRKSEVAHKITAEHGENHPVTGTKEGPSASPAKTIADEAKAIAEHLTSPASAKSEHGDKEDREARWRDLHKTHEQYYYVHEQDAANAHNRAINKLQAAQRDLANFESALGNAQRNADRNPGSVERVQKAIDTTRKIIEGHKPEIAKHQAKRDALAKERESIVAEKEKIKPGSKWNDPNRDWHSALLRNQKQDAERAKNLRQEIIDEKKHAVKQPIASIPKPIKKTPIQVKAAEVAKAMTEKPVERTPMQVKAAEIAKGMTEKPKEKPTFGYSVGDKGFNSYSEAVKHASGIDGEVIDNRTGSRKWYPMPKPDAKRMRMYNERKAAYEAQQRLDARLEAERNASAPVDPARQFGLFQKGAGGKPVEIGEKPGQTSMFGDAKPLPKPEPVKAEKIDPHQTTMEQVGKANEPQPAPAIAEKPKDEATAEVKRIAPPASLKDAASLSLSDFAASQGKSPTDVYTRQTHEYLQKRYGITPAIASQPKEIAQSPIQTQAKEIAEKMSAGESKAAARSEATPRSEAAAHQKQLDSDYEFARTSEVPNAGEDLKGSARHVRNAWKSLADAEANGTAESMVTRDMLLRNEPHNLMTNLKPHNAMASLAAHLAIQAFPTEVGTYPKSYGPQFKDRYGNSYPEAKKPAELREQYYNAYRAIKAKAEQLAASEKDPIKATAFLAEETLLQAKKALGVSADKPNHSLWTNDAYNPVGRGLLNTYKKMSGSERNSTSIRGRVSDFANRVGRKYGKIGPEIANAIASHVKDVLDGDSFNKTFETVKGKGENDFDPAQVYVTDRADRKGGRSIDASADFITKSLGMRGLQWGNSVTDDERQLHLKHAAEAFVDLADATGLDDSHMSLGGTLGLAIGARGHGLPLAHYEAGTKVINLTRKKGVGSLSHEWGHALDHAIAGGKTSAQRADFMSEHTSPERIATNEDGSYASNDKGRMYSIDHSKDPIWSAMNDVRAAMKSSGFNERLSKEISALKISDTKKKYWRSDPEKFARAFEKHTQVKLRGQGRENTYLTSAKDHPLWPTPAETAHMAPHFERLLAAVRQHHFKASQATQSLSREERVRSVARTLAQHHSAAADPIYLSASPTIASTEVGSAFPQNFNNLPIKYGWINAAACGSWKHPKTGQAIPINAARVDKWVAGIKLARSRNVDLPACQDHKETSSASLGGIYDAKRDGEKLQLLVGFYGDDAMNTARRNRFSIGIDPNFKDSYGNSYGEMIRHVATTPVPVIPGTGFVTLSRT